MSDIRVSVDPFPHLIADGWWNEQLLDQVIDEFPHPGGDQWIRYENEHEVKLHGDTHVWGVAARSLIEEFEGKTAELGDAFGIPDLSMETIGGGMHLIPPGGWLDVHVDFNRSPKTGLYRRLNLMCYLNRYWRDEGGGLQLWSDDRNADEPTVVVEPEFNRTVVFASSDRSWHGHPLPAQRWRMSMAAYFFSPEPPDGYVEEHSTVWR